VRSWESTINDVEGRCARPTGARAGPRFGEGSTVRFRKDLWEKIYAMVPCTVLGGTFIVIAFWPTLEADIVMRMVFACAGLVPIQFGLTVIGFVPWLLSKVPVLRGADTLRVALALLIFQMIAIQLLLMTQAPADEFPMGRPVAFVAIVTFGLVAFWLLVSALPESPRTKALASAAVTLLLASFGATAALVASEGSAIFAVGAFLLVGMAFHYGRRRRTG
jgi:hypothetical protein